MTLIADVYKVDEKTLSFTLPGLYRFERKIPGSKVTFVNCIKAKARDQQTFFRIYL